MCGSSEFSPVYLIPIYCTVNLVDETPKFPTMALCRSPSFPRHRTDHPSGGSCNLPLSYQKYLPNTCCEAQPIQFVWYYVLTCFYLLLVFSSHRSPIAIAIMQRQMPSTSSNTSVLLLLCIYLITQHTTWLSFPFCVQQHKFSSSFSLSSLSELCNFFTHTHTHSLVHERFPLCLPWPILAKHTSLFRHAIQMNITSTYTHIFL